IGWMYVSCSQSPGAAQASGSCPFTIPGNLANGTYELRFLSNDGYVSVATSNPITVSTVTLPVVTIVASDGTATENNPADTGVFTVSRSGSTAGSLNVNYTIGGTAVNGTDYQSLSATVTIAAGQSTATITVTPIDDSLAEGNETVVLTLSGSANYVVGTPASATVIIIDDEPPLPVVTITASDATATENNPADTGIFTVSRTGSTVSSLGVSYTIGGSAVSGTDYQSLSGTVTIPAGQTTAPITVVPIDDSAVEGNETVVVTLSGNSNYTVGTPGSATVTIVDNDVPAGPSLVVAPGSVAPGATVTASWSGIGSPAGRDWIGLYAQGAPDGSYWTWIYVSCSQSPGNAQPSGSCPLGIPGVPNGSY